MARFLVRMNAQLGMAFAADARPVSASGFSIAPLMPHSRGTAQELGIAGADDWFLATTEGDVDPGDVWDECHARITTGHAFNVTPGGITYAEPDIIQPFVVSKEIVAQELSIAPGAAVPPEEYWMKDSSIPHGMTFDWHLDDQFSGLRTARKSIQGDSWRVRIGHLDTGYTEGHQLLPENLDYKLQRSFVDGDNAQSAVDPVWTGLMKNPGHGTGTLCLLAGGRLTQLAFPDENRSDRDYLGGAPLATVIPVRIAPSVVLMRTSGFAQGLDYLLAPNGDPSQRVDVVSMSMGGVCSAAWTDIVNRAYEAGVVLCTAAGNHYGNFPPTSIVYPARYRRVIAACGVMADGRPYADLPRNTMCGCYGPQSKMATAMATYSPNLPWALYSNSKAFRWNGEGTSSATPQVAAAAALYIEKHYDEIKKIPEGWARVEAVRHALFRAAQKKNGGSIDARLGNGILDAMEALSIPVAATAELTQQPVDRASFPFLRVLTGMGLDQAVSLDMLNVEILQLTQQNLNLAKILPDPDATDFSPGARKNINDFLSAITTIPTASKHLKATLSSHLKTRAVSVLSNGAADSSQEVAEGTSSNDKTWKPPHPPCRKLRGYVFDPCMSTKLQYVDLSETTYKIRWEPKVKPGPKGEYLEIIDEGYSPIDLNASVLLAQDGLEPSEACPQFRQQMLYAVGMQTIDVFESALGRLVNWAPLPNGDFNPTLSLYPHGIQAPNAFYSPNDRAIYFGYFKATNLTGSAYPGMVYTSLSHDIIAHEMTHALLDGIHRSFREPSNPDVLAFHEAFADIVALLKQFSNIEVVRSQSAAVKGDLSMESLLGNLAGQFGDATKGRSALRSAYLSFDEHGNAERIQADKGKLNSATEAHDRGAILVAAIYGAFLSIYKVRTVDLYRIASNGVSEVALHLLAQDLVNRLALEASRAARQVLKMCIRAIDYCPPVDIRFGDFLRAIVTADTDVVPDDPLHYRVAFIESFRSWGIYPQGLEALSSETLMWPATRLLDPDKLKPILDLLEEFAGRMSVTSDRRKLYETNVQATKDLKLQLESMVKVDGIVEMSEALGLDPNIDIEITRLRFSHKTSPAGILKPRVLISIGQQSGQDAAGVPIRWGITLILDLTSSEILYSIRKTRKEIEASREAQHLDRFGGATPSNLALVEPFMLLHQS